MNFEGLFEALFFKADQQNPAHWSAVIFVSVFAFATLSFGLYVVISNWQDYRESLLPRWWLNRRAKRLRSLRRG
jgi:hypothetical protein